MANIHFKGKSAVWNHHLSVPYHTLEKDEKKSLKGENQDENLIIEGDNLLALKSLLPKYQGKIKCIYIDPPYNTGNEGWIYSDNVSSPTIKSWLGDAVGKEGEDLTRHDKWLSMMTPRLKLLRDLLSEEGAIFVSIDDNENHHLRNLLDDIFGIQNYITTIVWQKKVSPSNDAKWFSYDHEYVQVYAKNKSKWSPIKLKRSEEQLKYYKNPDNDSRGPWNSATYTSNKSKLERPNLYYPITNPNTGEKVYPKDSAVWAYSKDECIRHQKENRIYWGKDGKSKSPRYKLFLSEAKDIVPRTIWGYGEVGSTQSATREYRELFSETPFDTPKPSDLIKKIVAIGTKDDDIVLDSFAGSGTTAHAVLRQNVEDGGNRRFVLVEMESYANTITAERVRRVVKKDGLKTGFTYSSLGQAVDAESILSGKLPAFNEFAKYVYYLATGLNHPKEKSINEKDFFVGKTASESVYLLYKRDESELKKLAITLDWAREVNKKDPGKKVVYAPACYLDSDMMDEFNISFVSIPYNLFEQAK